MNDTENPVKKVEKKIERVKSCIQGLDELMEGGFPKDSTILITGGPGAGKSTFCSQFIVKGASEYKEPGVYISLEEDPDRMIKNLELSFGWPVSELVNKKLIFFTRAELYDFNKLKLMIEDYVDKFSASRLVIDPSTVIGMFFEKDLDIRKSILELDKILKRLGCTVLMTCEVPEGRKGISAFGVEEFTVDGIIILYYRREGDVFTRALTIRKMRATKHDTGIHPIEITRDGIIVYPTERVFQEI